MRATVCKQWVTVSGSCDRRSFSPSLIVVVDTYSGRAGYSTPAPTQGPFTAHYADLPDATFTSPTATATPTPYADGTRTDCNSYFNGDIFQGSIAGTNWKSNCELAAASYDVDLSDFGTWNTGECPLPDQKFRLTRARSRQRHVVRLFIQDRPAILW